MNGLSDHDGTASLRITGNIYLLLTNCSQTSILSGGHSLAVRALASTDIGTELFFGGKRIVLLLYVR